MAEEIAARLNNVVIRAAMTRKTVTKGSQKIKDVEFSLLEYFELFKRKDHF